MTKPKDLAKTHGLSMEAWDSLPIILKYDGVLVMDDTRYVCIWGN